ncbi:MAG: hypothetical protein H7A21_12670, partial [Spirochaetales bacterium]|nr:hypothetical protein [Spirochaetales bacterium]
ASWIALINQAVVGGQRPLSGSGLAAFSIGDKDELNRTSHVLTGILDTAIGSERWLNTFSVETANQSETTFTVRNKEYLIAYSLGTTAFVPLFAAKPQLGRCTTSNEDQTQPEIDFPSGIRCEGLADGLYAQEDLQDPNSLENIFLIEPSTLRVKNGRTTHGIRMRARWSNSGDLRKYFSGQSTKTKFGKEIVEVYFSKGPRARRLSVMMRKEGFEKPTSIMRFTQAGSRPLISMFGKEVRSLSQRLHPKPLSLLRWIVGMSQPQAMVIDPFGGSGVTGEAVLDLNRRDGSQRRYTLIEMADYFHTVLKPRIQKVMFSAKWKNGRPVLDPEAAARIPETGADDENGDDDSVDDDDVNGTEPEANGDVYGGVTHMFQYLNLEQYEDTLNNIVFTDSPQNILGNDPAEVRAAIGELFPEEERLSYYFTEGSWMSPSLGLSDLIRDPFSARLKITEQNEPKDTSIDPIATFNFLLGLRVRRYVVTEQQGRRVVIVFGRKDTEEHVLIWRKCDDTWDPDVERAWVQEQDWFKTSTVWTNGHNSFGGNRIEPELKRLMFEDVD